MAAGTILELAMPFTDLGLGAGETASFFVAVYDDRGSELERHPQNQAIELTISDARMEAQHWRV